MYIWEVISFHSIMGKDNKNQVLAKILLNQHFLHISVFCQNKPSFKKKKKASSLHCRNNLHNANQFTFPTLQTNASRSNKYSKNLIASFPAPCSELEASSPTTLNSWNKTIRNNTASQHRVLLKAKVALVFQLKSLNGYF